jgi:hypothetical protein
MAVRVSSQNLMRQLVTGADTKNFAYPDIRPRKVLFTRSTALQPDDTPISYDDWIGQVETIDGSALKAQAPRYHVSSYAVGPSLLDHAPDNHQVKLIGFAEKILLSELCGPAKVFGCRAPEVVFDAQLGPSADVWSLGLALRSLMIPKSLLS